MSQVLMVAAVRHDRSKLMSHVSNLCVVSQVLMVAAVRFSGAIFLAKSIFTP
jgi:hypothetical protein